MATTQEIEAAIAALDATMATLNEEASWFSARHKDFLVQNKQYLASQARDEAQRRVNRYNELLAKWELLQRRLD